MDTLSPTQPSGYKQLIRLSLALYKKSFSRVILLSLMMSLIVFLPRLLTIYLGQDMFVDLPPLSWKRIWIVAVELASLIFFIGIVWRMHCVLIGKKEKLREDVDIGIHKVLSVFVAGILQSIILFAVCVVVIGIQFLMYEEQILFSHNLLGMILTILIFALSLFLIFYILTLFIFLIPLIAIENCHILDALRKSVHLGWNHWWRIFSLQITPWLVYVLILLFARFVLNVNFHIYFIAHGPDTYPMSLLHMLIFALYLPWIAATMVVQLNDLEIRDKLVKVTNTRKRKK